MNIQLFTAGIKKELWEFRKVLLWLPIVIAALAIVLPVFQLFRLEDHQWNNILRALTHLSELSFSEHDLNKISESSFAGVAGLFIPFIAISLIVQLYYLTSCLFDERRDLSVYFWRSLPVSDAATIGTKLLTGGLVIPIIFMIVASITLVTWVLIGLVISVILASSYSISLWEVWGHITVISSLAKIWINLLPCFLWLLPLYTWFMLASMFARKAPFLWAVVPVAVLAIMDGIFIQFYHLDSFFIHPVIGGYFTITDSSIASNFAEVRDVTMLPFYVLLDKVSAIGVAAAAAMLYLTYWLRVNRSEK